MMEDNVLNSNDYSRVGTLEEESFRRQERLQQMKKLASERQVDDQHMPENPLPKPKFRSYNPSDNQLKENKLPKIEPESIEEHIRDQLNALKDNSIVNDVDLETLAPRKIDWDLKRNIQKKLDKLNKRTEKAIFELVQAKMDKELEKERN